MTTGTSVVQRVAVLLILLLIGLVYSVLCGVDPILPRQLQKPQKPSVTATETNSTSFHARSNERIRELVNSLTIMAWADDDFAPFKPLFDADKANEDNRLYVWRDTTREFVEDENLCSASKSFKDAGARKYHVLLTHFNENWGAMSSPVPDRTVDWGVLEDHWKDDGCSPNDIMAYLNDNHTLAVVTTQHQSVFHPKVHSIPLGIDRDKMHTILRIMHGATNGKSQWLMINHNDGSKHRAAITKAVVRNFGGRVNNTYGRGDMKSYYEEMQRSRFVLCPSGLGWDSYRIWEALYMGAFPIVELYNRTDGWHRTLGGLPVLWVNRLENVTPDLLESAYADLSKDATMYTYEKLTVGWWLKFINSFGQTATRMNEKEQQSVKHDRP